MAEALVGGLIATGWATAAEIGVIEISDERRARLAETFDGLSLAVSAGAAASDPDFALGDLLVAVKPQHVADVGAALADAGVERVLSIAAGVRIEALHDSFGEATRIVRAMPNTPALVGKGAAAISASGNAADADVEWARSILSAVGTVDLVVETELDAVTGLSGSGPAYVFLLAEAMTAAGIEQGLSPTVADTLTRQTILGAATLLAASDETPAQLRSNVTSPGGTTAAAIAVMQQRGLEEAVRAGIAAAAERSVELGNA